MTKPLIFLGTNSVLERYIEACDRQNQPIAGIIDGDWYGNRESFAGLPVLDSETELASNPDKYKDHVFFIATNWHPLAGRDIDKRLKYIDLIDRLNLPCINLIDPASYVSRYAQLGKGIFIGHAVSIEPYCQIKDFVLFHGGNFIGHHSTIDHNSVFQRSASLHGKVGKNCYIGVDTNVFSLNNSVTMGDNVVVAPCLYVTRDVEDNETVTMSKDSRRVYQSNNPSK